MEQLAEPETRIWPLHKPEEVEFDWPEKGVLLEHDSEGERVPAARWIRFCLDELLEYYSHPYFEDENVPAPHWSEEEKARQLHEIYTLVVLPFAVTEAAWLRVFGRDNAHRSADGSLLFSAKELTLLAGAFWRGSGYRLDYISAKNNAEAAAARRRKSSAAFKELLDWDES